MIYIKFNKNYSVFVNNPKKPLSFCKDASCSAITDTSSNNILGPKEYIDAIHDAMEAKPFYLDRYRVMQFLV